ADRHREGVVFLPFGCLCDEDVEPATAAIFRAAALVAHALDLVEILFFDRNLAAEPLVVVPAEHVNECEGSSLFVRLILLQPEHAPDIRRAGPPWIEQKESFTKPFGDSCLLVIRPARGRLDPLQFFLIELLSL